MKNIRIKSLATLAISSLCLVGCGGGDSGGVSAVGGSPVEVNAFSTVAKVVSSGASEKAEPVATENLILSTSDTVEP